MTDFAHISPTPYLDIFAASRPFHLVLAHLVEDDATYAKWYNEIANTTTSTTILDNSAFEMYKRRQPMYLSDKLIDMAYRVCADYIVMTDYPDAPARDTIETAIALAPKFRAAGFGTFFVPQAEIGNVKGLVESFRWAAQADEVDYIGVSILAVPNAFGVETGNNLQRFLSRWKLMRMLEDEGILDLITCNDKKIHFLGMVDGPNEISLVSKYLPIINTWDSSAAVWAGLNGISFDDSPTGLMNGKLESEVDFDHNNADVVGVIRAMKNIKYIDNLLKGI